LFVKDVANVEEDEYVVTIKGTMRYKLATDHVSTRMLFRKVAVAMQHTKERCSLSKLGGINDSIVGQYVCVGVAFALQHIADLCVDKSIWALSRFGHYHLPTTVVPTAASTSSTCTYACATAASC